MIEIVGDLFEWGGDAICITTNGQIRKDGACVMGRGVALQATIKWPGIERVLGRQIMEGGNKVHRLTFEEGGRIVLCMSNESNGVHVVPWHIFSLPVKHHWRDKADIKLIERSLRELTKLTESMRVGLPRPGCGNGGLDWNAVRPLVHRMLPEERYVIIERSP